MDGSEKKNNGSPVAESSAAPQARVPAMGCTLSREELRNDNYKLADFCPICKKHGEDVMVGEHPSQPAAPTGTDLALCFPRPLCFPPVPPCAPPVPLVPLCFLLLTWPRVRCACVCLLCVVLLVVSGAHPMQHHVAAWSSNNVPVPPSLKRGAAEMEASNQQPSTEHRNGVMKRKLDTQSPGEQEEDEQKEDEQKTSVVLQINPCSGSVWYLGQTASQLLYIRPSLFTVGAVVLYHVRQSRKMKAPVVVVVTGASGIGKSWSINAFMQWLLMDVKFSKVVFHSGDLNQAFSIQTTDDGRQECAWFDVDSVSLLPEDWVYVYDSPGSKASGRHARQRPLGQTIIFSSPKGMNYGYATSKGMGATRMVHVSRWSHAEMMTLNVKKEIVDASFKIWGGNLRALFQFQYDVKLSGNIEVTRARMKQFAAAQIRMMDDTFVKSMANMLMKATADAQFARASEQSPGHVLVPEPANPFPKHDDPAPLEDFVWRFCSPLVELMFYEHLATLKDETIVGFLKSVFETPGAKGVLFEKAVEFIVTSGKGEFKSCGYHDRSSSSTMKFPKCVKKEFGDDKSFRLQMIEAVRQLEADQKGAEDCGVALVPTSPTQDATDLFVVLKKQDEWQFLQLQDTIARKHSFHPVKIVAYCAVWVDVMKDKLSKDQALKACKYVAVVPKSQMEFKFEKEERSSKSSEVDSVAELLDVCLPPNAELEDIVKQFELAIPSTQKGTQRKLNRSVVLAALVLKRANEFVLQDPEKGICSMLYDVAS
jgi:hypothetical protein